MRRRIGLRDYWVGVISTGRPANVAKMQAQCGPLTWYVKHNETQNYWDAGAANVVKGGGLCESRNAMLDDGHIVGLPVVQLSDDLTRIKSITTKNDKGRWQAKDIHFDEAVEVVHGAMQYAGAKLGGAAPTSNPFFYNDNKAVQTRHFIVGDFIVVEPSPERFDVELKLKEDYDLTCQHLAAYGRVARADMILPHFAHRTNAGGAVDFRTPEREQQAIAILRRKWGTRRVVDNPKRPNEVVLRWC